jgi:serine protease Do
MKTMLCLVVLLTACTQQLPPLANASPPPLGAVVALVDEDTHEPYCSGVVTPEGILTAEHCVTDEPSVLVGFYEDVNLEGFNFLTAYRVQVLHASEACDLAMLTRPIRAGIASPIADREPRHGESVWVVGMPMGLPYTTHPGVISGPARDGHGHLPLRWFQTSAGIFPGNSGGPVFAADGSVLGIISFGMTMNGTFLGHLGMAVPANNLDRCW